MALEPNNNSSSPIDTVIPLHLPITTKLNQSNYLTWKSQVMPLLHGYNLIKFIDSPSPTPTISTVNGQFDLNPQYVLWHRQDQLLLGWICSSLSEPILAQVVSSNSTMDLWNTLHKLYSSTSRARLSELRRQVQSDTKGDTSISQFLQQMRQLADELAFIGSPLSDEDLVIATINGLGPEFNAIVAAVTIASRLEPLSFTNLHGLLLSHEVLLKNQSGLASSSSLISPTAFQSNRYGSSRNRSSFRTFHPSSSQTRSTPPLLPIPPQPNNIRPVSNFTPASLGSSGLRNQCQICSRMGHSAKLCYSRYNPDPAWSPNPKFQVFSTEL